MQCESAPKTKELSLLSRVFEHLDQAIVIASLNRKILSLNSSARKLFGYTQDELKNKSTLALYADSDEFLRLGRSRYHSNSVPDTISDLVSYKTKFGSEFIGKTSGGIVKDENGNDLYFVAMISDESVALAVEEALNELHSITSSRQLNFEQRVDAILKLGAKLFGLPIGIFSHITGDQYTIQQAIHPENSLEKGMTFDFSGTYCCHVYQANDVQGFNHVSASEIASHPCFKTFGLESYIGAPVLVDGERFGTLNFSSPRPSRPFVKQDFELVKLFSDWVGHEIARNKDLHALKMANEQMETIANTDVLTKLPNRRFSEINLQKLIKDAMFLGNQLSVAILDFDHFKDINDNYGHQIGDQALQLFGEIAKSSSRSSDFIGRWGGEEFIAVYPNLDANSASAILKRIMEKLQNTQVRTQQIELELTVSIGLTTLQAGDDMDLILTRADNLLYKAKHNGRNQIQHD